MYDLHAYNQGHSVIMQFDSTVSHDFGKFYKWTEISKFHVTATFWLKSVEQGAVKT